MVLRVPKNRAETSAVRRFGNGGNKKPYRFGGFISRGGAVLADNYGNALIYKGCFEQIHVIVEFVYVVFVSPVTARRGPVRIFLDYAEVGGSVIVNRYGAAVHIVVGHLKERVAGQLNIGVVARYQEMASIVVSAGRTHRIHKFLVYFVQQAKGFGFSVGASAPSVPEGFPAAFLVQGFKHQLVGVIRKGFADLLPYAGVFSHTLVFFGGEF